MDSSYKILDRIGYGSFLNNIYIDNNSNTLIKTSKNEAGDKKIKREIQCLIEMQKIGFPIPVLYDIKETFIKMEFKKNYIELYKVFFNYDLNKKKEILNKINNYLNILHKSNNIEINNDIIKKDFYIETFQKIKERFIKIKPIVLKYNITIVNDIEIMPFDKIESLIYEMSNNICNNYLLELNKYSVLHGDCQFNNILIHPEKEDIVFIDPRGYFGNTLIYGLPEYDYAKINFALSGYDWFDNSKSEIILDNLKDSSVFIKLINYKDLMNLDNPIVKILFICIWLGNAEMFINDEVKCMESYLIASYWTTIYGNNS
jgi:RIO-like serine/threonine protein kinase